MAAKKKTTKKVAKKATGEKESTSLTYAKKDSAWNNVLTGLGTSRDKKTFANVRVTKSNGSFQDQEDYYSGDDMGRKIAEKPALEMVRKWFDVMVDDSVKQTDDGARVESESAEKKVDTGKAMAQALHDLDAQSKVFEAILWARVYGGSAMMLGIQDGSDDPAQPLNEENIQSFKFLKVYDRWELNVHSRYTDVMSQKHGEPETYTIVQNATVGGTEPQASVPIHETRFIRFDGPTTGRRRRKRQDGWNDSIYTALEYTLRDFATVFGSSATLVADFAQAVLKIKDLAIMLKSDPENLVLKRLIQLDTARSVARAIPLDAEHEDFERKQTPMGGLPEMLDKWMIRLAASADMPVTVLFGRAPAGMNATGESDLSIWREAIRAKQETMLRPLMERLVKLVFLNKEGPTNGLEPENWSIEFNPLQEMSEQDEAAMRLNVAQADAIYLDRGVVTADEIAISRYGGDAYSANTVLDTEQREEDALAGEELGLEPDEIDDLMKIKAAQDAPIPEQLRQNPGEKPEGEDEA